MASARKRLANVRHRAAKRRGTISNILGVFAFVNQITAKDSAIISQQKTVLGKLQTVANVITGRMFGLNFLSGPTFKQTLNPTGVFNKWTGLGVGLSMIYPIIPRVPYKSWARSIGKRWLAAGIIGGLFDDNVTGGNVKFDLKTEGQSQSQSQYQTSSQSSDSEYGGSSEYVEESVV